MNKELYDSILKIFVGNDPYRSWADNPFTIGEKVFATQFHSMVIIDKDKVSYFDAPTHKIENILRIVPKETNKSFLIKVDTIKKSFDLVPKVECTDTFGQNIDCGECDGDGEVDWEYKQYTERFECPACKGDGLTEHSYEKPNGTFKMESGHYLDVLNSRFSTGLFQKIIEVAEILKVEEFELIYQTDDKSVSLFKVLDIEVLLMPIMKSLDNKDDVILTLN